MGCWFLLVFLIYNSADCELALPCGGSGKADIWCSGCKGGFMVMGFVA